MPEVGNSMRNSVSVDPTEKQMRTDVNMSTPMTQSVATDKLLGSQVGGDNT